MTVCYLTVAQATCDYSSLRDLLGRRVLVHLQVNTKDVLARELRRGFSDLVWFTSDLGAVVCMLGAFRWVPLQGACVVDHCESLLGNESMPICRAERHAEEMANQPTWTGTGFASHERDYYHATVVCTSDPCQSLVCAGGHDTDPTCCVETVAGEPCEPVPNHRMNVIKSVNLLYSEPCLLTELCPCLSRCGGMMKGRW